MDNGHAAQNGQVAPQFGDANQMNGNLMPNASMQAAQSFGAGAVNAYQAQQMPEQMPPTNGQFNGYQMPPIQGQPMYDQAQQFQQMPQYQMYPGQMMPEQAVQQPMMQPEVQQTQMQMPNMQQMPQKQEQPQVQAPQMQAQQAPQGNALESLKKGVNLKDGLSAADVTKMDAAMNLLDQMGPKAFYEEFSSVAETTVDTNYGVKVGS
jgi:hypothetical protein